MQTHRLPGPHSGGVDSTEKSARARPGLWGIRPCGLSYVGPDPGALSRAAWVMKGQSSASEQGSPALWLPL